jgi:alkyldihydroxyacetonephosphate synthase
MTKQRRKFWGWGYEGSGLSNADMKPVEAHWAEYFGVDGFTADAPPEAEEISLREPRLAIPASLEKICTTDHHERLVHTYGRSLADQIRAFRRDFTNAPDVVAFPRDERDVVDLLDWCGGANAAAIPFGGGSSAVGGVEAAIGERYAGAVSIDMLNLDRVLEVDKDSRAARIQAGVYGPALESQLRPHGLTLRHFPQSFEFSTLGGWIATRSGGHFATLYTHIDDFVESMRIVTPTGIHDSFRLPGSGAGPSPDRMFIGSEGTLGIITEAWMRLQDRPTERASRTVEFKDYMDGVRAVRAIAQAGLYPANCRLLHAGEVKSAGVGDGSASLLVLGFESADHTLAPWLERALECCADHGGIIPPEAASAADDPRGGAAGRWRDAFIKGCYIREELTARGILRETFETSTTWDRFEDLYEDVTGTTLEVIEDVTGHPGALTCRFTHAYPDGPAPYFTYHGMGDKPRMLDQFQRIKEAASDVLLKHRATITHHHAVGRDHRPWYDQQAPAPFVAALGAAKKVLDPKGILNPGVLIDPLP